MGWSISGSWGGSTRTGEDTALAGQRTSIYRRAKPPKKAAREKGPRGDHWGDPRGLEPWRGGGSCRGDKEPIMDCLGVNITRDRANNKM